MIMEVVPWYTHDTPFSTIGNTFETGDCIPVKISRNALVDLEAHSIRELVRVDDVSKVQVSKLGEYHYIKRPPEYEVLRMFEPLSIDKGKKTIISCFKLPDKGVYPPICEGVYMFRGSLSYVVFGFWHRTVNYTTNKFTIKRK